MTLSDGWPPFYSERKTSAAVDINQLYVAFVVGALAFALILILPGVRGIERSYFLLRWSLTLLVGALIIACGQGLSWQVADITADFRYKVSEENITNFNLGLRIGLNEFNVTLEGPRDEDINLNEQFTFLATDDMILDSLKRGVPFPILTVAEHFSSKRFHSLWPWGRKYWMAGHYAAYLLWTALACWGLTNVLFHMTLQHGSVFMILTGILLLCANISFSTVEAGKKLKITLGYQDSPNELKLVYGWCFWSCLFVGFGCVVLGTIAYVLEKVKKSYLEKFFMLRDDEDTRESISTVHEVSRRTSESLTPPPRGILKSSSSSTSSGIVNPSFVMETIDESKPRKKSAVTISEDSDEVFVLKADTRFEHKHDKEML